MKKGLITLFTVTLAFVQVSNSFAEAPVISDPGDVIIGDIEDGTTSNLFVFEDAINIRELFVDDDTEDSTSLKWSFHEAAAGGKRININGVASLQDDLSVLGEDDPTDPRASSRIDTNNSDPYGTQDANAFTLTFRNTVLSPNAGPNVQPSLIPSDVDIIESQTRTVTLFASDCSTFTSVSILVFTANNTSDSISGGVTFTPVIDADFTGGSTLGWTGTAAFGLPGTTSINSGLCMTTGAAGDFAVQWVSPQEYVDLVDNRVYRVRSQMRTDQSAPNAIPLWSLDWDNFDSGAGFVSYGGSNFFISVLGGSAGIGTPNGRTTFQTWITPNAVSAPQFRSTTGGAYDPANASFTDIRLTYTVNDTNDTIDANTDTGTICIERVRVDSTIVTNLSGSVVFGGGIDSTDMAWDPFPFSSATAQGATINDTTDTARVQLVAQTGTGVDGQQFIPNDASQGTATPDPLIGRNPLKFDPIAWEADTLYSTEIGIRSETSETSPITIFTLGMDVPTTEQIVTSWSSRGAPGGVLDRAASPRTTAATYRVYWFSNNETASTIPTVDRARGTLQVFNRGDLSPSAGGDAIILDSFRIRKISGAPAN